MLCAFVHGSGCTPCRGTNLWSSYIWLGSLPPLSSRRGPIGGCCGGVKGLLGAAKTPEDRKTACTCLKSAANSIKGIDTGKAAGLPGVCGVSIPYKISPSTDCSQVQ
ncbi:non-specific lipid-transfer protein 2 isoform X2 [Solanum verrucosum]|uniref:non-specific lipid-transfer protein 2 isoform X2 n=1 Tax=Solanum verrucosum TaxID=315347 RepID=UPI0020D11204|nr:non-specific lipid-transfer protein 2 isoform X2 [Solanum verrucosum]